MEFNIDQNIAILRNMIDHFASCFSVSKNKFHDRVSNYSHDGIAHPTRKSGENYFMNLNVLKQ